MKIYTTILGTAMALICFSGCRKTIEPISVPMRHLIATVQFPPGQNTYNNEKCYISLKGYVFSDEDTQGDYGDGLTVSYSDVDLSVIGGYIYAGYQTATQSLAVVTISKSSFDTLTRIESIKRYTDKAPDTGEPLTTGEMLAFNISDGYGLIYVKSADGNGATLDMKYYYQQ